MTFTESKLMSPENVVILGVKRVDGTICPISVSCDTATMSYDIVIDHDCSVELLERDGELVYIDADNNEWLGSEVLP